MIFDFLQSGYLLSSPTPSGKQLGDAWIGWGTPHRASRPDSSRSGDWVYAPDFFLKDEKPWWHFPHSSKINLAGLLAELSVVPNDVVPSWDWQSGRFEDFNQTVIALQEQIHSGQLKKAVPVIFESMGGEMSWTARAVILRKLLSSLQTFAESPHGASDHLMVYGLWSGSEGILGATPETLFESTPRGSIQTMALAGTRRRTNPDSLMQDPKERHEHQLVIDGIRESLDRVASELGGGHSIVGSTSERELPTLVHLHTPIEWVPEQSNLPATQIFDLLTRELHPTPALGTSPRKNGMALLESLNGSSERQRFGAPFGVLERGLAGESFRCVVAIRNVQWSAVASESRIRIGAGCGIVAQSQASREWAELEAKLQAVKLLLGIHSEAGVLGKKS